MGRTQRATSRRDFLRAAGGLGVALGGIGLAGSAARAQHAGPKPSPLRGGLVQIGGAGGNVIALAGADGLAIVDSGAPENAWDLAAAVRAHVPDGAPVALLFNTHWHLAHTGGNELLAGADTRIIAHENTRLWMSTEHYVDWQDRNYPPRPAAALPNETFFSSDPEPLTRIFGNAVIEYGHLREAHTDGDIYVLFREENVVVAGGAVAVAEYPVPDHATGGWIGGLMEATRKLLDITDAETLIVPGRGPAQTRRHLEAQLEMVTTVRGRAEELMRKGRSAEEMIAAGITAEFDADWGSNRDRFVSNVYDGLWWQGRLDGSL